MARLRLVAKYVFILLSVHLTKELEHCCLDMLSALQGLLEMLSSSDKRDGYRNNSWPCSSKHQHLPLRCSCTQAPPHLVPFSPPVHSVGFIQCEEQHPVVIVPNCSHLSTTIHPKTPHTPNIRPKSTPTPTCVLSCDRTCFMPRAAPPNTPRGGRCALLPLPSWLSAAAPPLLLAPPAGLLL